MPALRQLSEILLCLADLEHLRAACGARALGGGPAILHGDGLGTLNLPGSSALDAISLHDSPLSSLMCLIGTYTILNTTLCFDKTFQAVFTRILRIL